MQFAIDIEIYEFFTDSAYFFCYKFFPLAKTAKTQQLKKNLLTRAICKTPGNSVHSYIRYSK